MRIYVFAFVAVLVAGCSPRAGDEDVVAATSTSEEAVHGACPNGATTLNININK